MKFRHQHGFSANRPPRDPDEQLSETAQALKSQTPVAFFPNTISSAMAFGDGLPALNVLD